METGKAFRNQLEMTIDILLPEKAKNEFESYFAEFELTSQEFEVEKVYCICFMNTALCRFISKTINIFKNSVDHTAYFIKNSVRIY